MAEDAVAMIEFSLRFRIFDNALLLAHEFFVQNQTAEILYLYAKAYLDSGSPQQAAMLITKYQNLISGKPDLIFLYALCFFESGKYSQAESVLKELDLCSICDEAEREKFAVAKNYYMGQIKLKTHRQVHAQENFINVYKSQPLMLSVLGKVNLKSVCSEANETEKSLISSDRRETLTEKLSKNTDLEEVQKLSPMLKSSIPVQKALGSYYFKCSKYDEAAIYFNELYKNYPYCIDGIDIYSTTLWQLKDEMTLNELARKSIEIAPMRPEPWIALGNLFSLRKSSDEAINMFNRAANLDKNCSYALTLAGHESLSIDMLKDASSFFRQAINRNPFEWSAWYGLGSVCFKQNDFCSAEYYTKKAIEINPMSSVLYYIYATILSKSGRTTESLQMIENSLKLDPHNLLALYLKSITLDSLDRMDEALQCLKYATGFAPHEPEFSYLRAKISQEIGDIKDSLYWYTNAVIYGHPGTHTISKLIDSMIDHIICKMNLQKTEQVEN